MKAYIAASLLALGSAGALGATFVAGSTPASAQLSVFDTSNYTQNLLTAARTLSQINNQIQSLQNEAQMLAGQAKNLAKIDFPQMDALQQRLGQIDRLMGQAQGIGFRVGEIEAEFGKRFPSAVGDVVKRDARVAAARQRIDSEMAAFRQAMGVQSEIVENVRDDAEALKAIVARSQGAEGSLAAQQATNQLLALAAKQQFQIQQLMAAQFRNQALESARRGQSERAARARSQRFLGDGKAYTPPK